MHSGGFGHAAQVQRWRACGHMIQAGCDTSRVTHHSCLNYVTHSNLHQHVATRDNTPVPGGQYSHSRGDNTPTPRGDNTPTPGGTILPLPGDNTPAAGGTILPLPADNTPTPGGTILPLPGGQYSHSQGTIVPLPGRQYSHSQETILPLPGGTMLPLPGDDTASHSDATISASRTLHVERLRRSPCERQGSKMIARTHLTTHVFHGAYDPSPRIFPPRVLRNEEHYINPARPTIM